MVVVSEGKVEGLVDSPPGDRPCELLGDALLMPGLVDSHVHINEPGRTEWEGYATATTAAAAGGVTTLVDMPLNSIPVTTSASSFAAKLEVAQGQLRVDCGFWGGVVPGNSGELAAMASAGVLGFCQHLSLEGHGYRHRRRRRHRARRVASRGECVFHLCGCIYAERCISRVSLGTNPPLTTHKSTAITHR